MRTLIAPFALLLLATPVWAAEAESPFTVTVEDIADGGPIPMKHALCEATPEGKSTEGENIRPAISWSGAPAETKSYALVVTDPDVPADFTDAGKDGKIVAADAKRQTFYHWALADIPAGTTNIAGGPGDKAPSFGAKATGSLSKYVKDATQYGGPCPPWNDERVHHYHFTVYALDVAKLALSANPTAHEVEAEAKKHALAEGEVVGTYTLNRTLMK